MLDRHNRRSGCERSSGNDRRVTADLKLKNTKFLERRATKDRRDISEHREG